MGIVTDPETIVGKVFKKHEICMAVLDNRCYDLLLEHQQGMILLAPPGSTTGSIISRRMCYMN